MVWAEKQDLIFHNLVSSSRRSSSPWWSCWEGSKERGQFFISASASIIYSLKMKSGFQPKTWGPEVPWPRAPPGGGEGEGRLRQSIPGHNLLSATWCNQVLYRLKAILWYLIRNETAGLWKQAEIFFLFLLEALVFSICLCFIYLEKDHYTFGSALILSVCSWPLWKQGEELRFSCGLGQNLSPFWYNRSRGKCCVWTHAGPPL